MVDRVIRPNKVSYVSTDHYTGAFKATEYLIGLGHTKIAVLRGAELLYSDIERFAGFEEAMKKYKKIISKGLIFNCDFNEMEAYEATLKILGSDSKPTAIFSSNSKMLNGSIRAVQKLDFDIPGEISLLCFDQIAGYEIFKPKITCVTQQIKALGENSISYFIKINFFMLM